MATQSVKDILDAEIPKPLFSFKPGPISPLNSELNFNRPNLDNPSPTAHSPNRFEGDFVSSGANEPRYVKTGGMLFEPQSTNEVGTARTFHSGPRGM